MAETEAKKPFAQIAAEHEEFRRLNQSLRDFLNRPRPDVGEEGHHRWAATISRHLVNLHDKLVLHFRTEEEAEGFFDTIVDRAPSFEKRVGVLLGEHGEMLREIRDLMGQTLRYSEGKEPEDPRLRRRITSLLDTLSQHEVNETELLQRIEYRDIGTGD